MFSPSTANSSCLSKEETVDEEGANGAVQAAPWDGWGPPELVWLSHKGAHTWRLMSLSASSLRAEQRSAECKPSAAKPKAAEHSLNMLRFTRYTGILLLHSSCLSLHVKCSFFWICCDVHWCVDITWWSTVDLTMSPWVSLQTRLHSHWRLVAVSASALRTSQTTPTLLLWYFTSLLEMLRQTVGW